MLNILAHVVLAAAFFGALQHFVLRASLGESLLWAGFGAIGAGILAYHQSQRRP